jgi:uncharacterized membrane protein
VDAAVCRRFRRSAGRFGHRLGVVAGVLFAFSTAVMPALSRQPPPSAIRTMQTINVRILNPLFLGVFLGTALVSAAVLVASFAESAAPGAPWAVAGATAYLVGTAGVTMVCNVPMNNHLDTLDAGSDAAARYWQLYLARWTAWNHVRVGAATLAAALLIVAARSVPA